MRLAALLLLFVSGYIVCIYSGRCQPNHVVEVQKEGYCSRSSHAELFKCVETACGKGQGVMQRNISRQHIFVGIPVGLVVTFYQTKTDLLSDYLRAELRNPRIPAFQPT